MLVFYDHLLFTPASLVECIRFPKRCRIESISIVPANVSAFQSTDVIGRTTDTLLELQCLVHLQSEPLSKRGILPLKKILLHYNPSDIHGQGIATYTLDNEQDLFTRFVVLRCNKPADITLAVFGDVSKNSVQIVEGAMSIEMISSRHEKPSYILDSFRGKFHDNEVKQDRRGSLEELVRSLHFDETQKNALSSRLDQSRSDGKVPIRDDAGSSSTSKTGHAARYTTVTNYRLMSISEFIYSKGPGVGV
ncbi:hypothetical protein NEOLI_000922 [Neolecta irregularis DAH-3]|uniref:Uncharacterized protein n=1 Tax=Neolecta irregularis (strain DAH-3) TaxID=1198029 RepID=A0A1U7LVY7_NEOID|nr:hypothetical protein NEOLI_000922 [Neolecta irregularis DAH-3]|eukprot:OLL26846.1 hypothetical protein NEOLI_000922 [Neolecta irregularis DAH-3]